MNPTTLRQAAFRSTRSLSSKASSSSSSSSTISSYPPKKSNGRTLPASTLRSLISLHHQSAGFLHNPPEELSVGFDNVFRYTRDEPSYRGYNEFNSTVQFNFNLNPPGGMENLIEAPKSTEARGLDHRRGRSVTQPELTRKIFKSPKEDLWSQSQDRGVRRDNEYLTDRELQVQEALFGTWERGGQNMSKVEPSLDGLLEFVDAKGKSVEEHAKEWQNRDGDRDQGVDKEEVKGTEDGL